MSDTQSEKFARSAKELRASLLVVLEHVDELSRLAEERSLPPGDVPAGTPAPICRVDRQTLSVFWQERACYLGHTLLFRLLERLAQRSDQYLPAERLVNDLWGGPRAPSTIRSAVSDLRLKLRAGGLDGLAKMIDGSNPGYYGLMSRRIDLPAGALPTQVRRGTGRHSRSCR